jgi:hypothetical protein
MDLCGEVVVHKTFGTGHIVAFANNYITVQFHENKTERMFVYPTAFGDYLVLENNSFQDQIDADKQLIAQELAKTQRINAEIKKYVLPIESKKGKARTKKVAATNTTD